ncbi:ETS-like protein pointed isoform X1 [Apis mellifera caucasica]|nr:ETS-like protein pointed isoform X1 [Apis mellifera caucasica]
MRDIRLDTSNRDDISCILEQRRRMEKGRIGWKSKMDMESLYDYGEEEQDFYEESPGTRKGYPIDHRSIKRDARGVGSYLGGGSISDGGGMLTGMAKLMKQELASDAEEEGLVPALSGRFTSMRKVPSLSDLSDPESSLVSCAQRFSLLLLMRRRRIV